MSIIKMNSLKNVNIAAGFKTCVDLSLQQYQVSHLILEWSTSQTLVCSRTKFPISFWSGVHLRPFNGNLFTLLDINFIIYPIAYQPAAYHKQ